jgi:competence protein ComEA
MNFRLPVVAGIVVIAAAAAGLRAMQPRPAPSGPALSFETSSPAALPSGYPGRRREERGRRAKVTSSAIVVYVAGEVMRTGVYRLPPTARAGDAVHAAGGLRADADPLAVNLAQPLNDGDEVAVPARGAADDAVASPKRRRSGSHRHRSGKRHRKHRRAAPAAEALSDAPPDVAPVETVNLNSADASELETLPGLGAALAERIVTFRELNGPFQSVDDLLDVGGMTEGKLDELAPFVTTR